MRRDHAARFLTIATCLALSCCTVTPRTLAQLNLDDYRTHFSPNRIVMLTNAVFLSAAAMAETGAGDLRLGSATGQREVFIDINEKHAAAVAATSGDDPRSRAMDVANLAGGVFASYATVSGSDENHDLVKVRLEDAMIARTGARFPVIILTSRANGSADEAAPR
jgi:hypothetical protein